MYIKIRKLMNSSEKLENFFQKLYKILILLPGARVYVRRDFAFSYYKPKLKEISKWAIKNTENDNFYYSLKHRNILELTSLIALITNKSFQEIEKYISEIENDLNLKKHIESMWQKDSKMRDAKLGLGRRIGWYAFTRALKPQVIVETGVHHGVGSCVLITALMKNHSEGFEGYYYGTDIDPDAGILITDEYKKFGEILYGDSLTSLSNLNKRVDFFINDSDHSENYEEQEYNLIASKLSDKSLLLGDNSHVTDKLVNFAKVNNRPYLFFKEDPKDHWYPGAGIGISPSEIPLAMR